MLVSRIIAVNIHPNIEKAAPYLKIEIHTNIKIASTFNFKTVEQNLLPFLFSKFSKP